MSLHTASYVWRTVSRTLISFLIITLLSAPLMAADTGDSALFMAGFNAYKKGEYQVAVENLSKVLKQYPTTQLRDMTLFWLARSSFRSGDRIGAAVNMSLFLKEFPDHPLKGTVEEELLASAVQYEQSNAVAKAPSTGPTVPPKTAEPSAVAEVQSVAAPVPTVPAAAAVPSPATPQVPEKAVVVAAVTAPAAQEPAAPVVVSVPTAVPKVPEKSAVTVVSAAPAGAVAPVEAVKPAVPAAAAPAAQQPSVKPAEPVPAAVATAPAPATVVLAAAAPEVKQPPVRKGKRSRRHKHKGTREQVIAQKPATTPSAPASSTATAAASASPAPQREQAPVAAAGISQTVTVVVEQFADLSLSAATPAARPEAGNRFAIPVIVVNSGNGNDSFALESGFPAEFAPRFVPSPAESAVTVTPTLAPGESWRGLLLVDVPPASIDGQKLRYPLRAVSRFNTGISRTSELALAVSAPLLRGVVKPAQDSVKPGDLIVYRVTLMNVGSAAVRDASLRLDYPSLLDPASYPGMRPGSGQLLLDSIALASGESREVTVSFRLKKGSPAQQELICRGELVNPALATHTIFVSPAATVGAVGGMTLSISQDRLVAVPGQVLTIPVAVTNSGNAKEQVSVSANLPAGFVMQYYRDLQGKGQRDPRETPVAGSFLLAPDETQQFIMAVTTNPEAADGSEATVPVAAETASGNAAKAAAALKIRFSRPVVELSLKGEGGRLKPGEITIVELTCVNRGSAVARSVSLEGVLPEQLELVTTEPVAAMKGKEPVWLVPELGAGEKRTFRIISRVRHGIRAGASLAITGRVSYEDNQGNKY